MEREFNLKNIMENKNLEVKFEPIVSPLNQSVIGFQASSIGASIEENLIPMEELLHAAKYEDMAIELDRLYRENAVEKFSEIYSSNKDMLLFINITASIISKFIGSGILMDLINEYNIKHENVVLQIVEDKVEDVENLKTFIDLYRSKGFLISVSDIGYGSSNLDKISYIEPDIIKISDAITKNIDVDYYKQEIFKSLVNLSKSIGALVIGDGITTRGEALAMIELKADMIEGTYFGEFFNIDKKFIDNVKEKIDSLSKEYKEYITEKVNQEKSRHRLYDSIINDTLEDLSMGTEEEFNDKLLKAMDKCDSFESIYILNDEGVQNTKVFTHNKNMRSQKALIFNTPEKGTNHSLKKYYYFLRSMSLKKYVTEPYVSVATGNLCVTISSSFKDKEGKEYIFCVDFDPNYINL